MSWHIYTWCIKNLITAIYRIKTHEPQLIQTGTVSSACHQAKLPVWRATQVTGSNNVPAWY